MNMCFFSQIAVARFSWSKIDVACNLLISRDLFPIFFALWTYFFFFFLILRTGNLWTLFILDILILLKHFIFLRSFSLLIIHFIPIICRRQFWWAQHNRCNIFYYISKSVFQKIWKIECNIYEIIFRCDI